MSNLQRSIRLLGRAESSLNSISAKSGEIFYDTTNQTLRVYNQSGPSILATEDYVDTAVNNIDLSGIDLSGLDLTGYATETYVTTRGYITSSALSGYALTSAIPTNNNQLTNGAGFITSSALSSYALTSAIPTNTNQLTNGAEFITSSALSGYALTSAIPTNTNQLTNGAGYITSSSLTGLATESFVGTAISNLIDAAPTALNTLNELAAALNDDANFATTVTTALGTKAPINNPTFTGTVAGVTATHVGLGNVTNESKVTMFTSPTFTSNGTNAVVSINSEGVLIQRGGLTLGNLFGSGGTRLTFREGSAQLGYIEPFQSPVPSGLTEGYNTGLKFVTGRSTFAFQPQFQLAPQGTTLTPGDSGLTISGNVKVTRDSNRSLFKDVDYTFLYFAPGPFSNYYYAVLRPVAIFGLVDTTLGLEKGMAVDLFTSEVFGPLSVVLLDVVYSVVNDELLISWFSLTPPGVGATGTDGTLNSILRPDGGIITARELRASALTVTGTTTLQQSIEKIEYIAGAAALVQHDFLLANIWYHTAINGNFGADFVNISNDSGRVINMVLLLEQDVVTAYIPFTVAIDGQSQTIRWQGGEQPTGNPGAIDVVSFTLIRGTNNWTVLGSLSTYG